MSKVIIPDGIDMQTLAFIISEALSIEDLELFMIELNALIAIKNQKSHKIQTQRNVRFCSLY